MKIAKQKKKKSNKLHAIKKNVDGITFHSTLESEYYIYLKQQKRQGLIKDFSLQPKFILQEKFIIKDKVIYKGSHTEFKKLQRKFGNTQAAITYTADFLIINNDNSKVLIDVKGKTTDVFNIKKKLFHNKYPHLELKVVCQDDRYYKMTKRLSKAKTITTQEKIKKEIKEFLKANPIWVDFYAEQKRQKTKTK